jgi:phosphoglycolate phosphatase
MILRAMGEAGAEPRATVMVGDTTYDMQMARNDGASADGAAWAYHYEQHLWDTGAHAVIGDNSDLAGVVERVTGPTRSP